MCVCVCVCVCVWTCRYMWPPLSNYTVLAYPGYTAVRKANLTKDSKYVYVGHKSQYLQMQLLQIEQ